jgi:hypothetical protein
MVPDTTDTGTLAAALTALVEVIREVFSPGSRGVLGGEAVKRLEVVA